MAAVSTVYDVILRYQLQDRATRGMRGMEAQAKRTAKSTSLLGRTLGRAGAAAAGFFGLRAAKGALIDFTSSMEQARLQTAGLLKLNLGGTFNQQLKVANRLVGDLQQRAKASTATTGEMVSFMSEIVGPATKAGLQAKDLAEFTAGAVVAAKAFGREQTAALDIQQALLQNVAQRDVFARLLIDAAGMEREEFNKLNRAERLAVLQRAVRAPAIQDLARAQEKSFAGVVSTFKDNLQIALGKVGLPLFQEITKEVQRWNQWFEKNPEKMKAFARDFGNALKGAFVLIRDIAAFLFRHRDLLMLIAKAILISKGLRLITGRLAAVAEFGQGLTNSSARLAVFTGKLGNAVGTLGRLAPVLAGLFVGAKELASRVNKQQEANLSAEQRRATLVKTTQEIEEERSKGLRVGRGQRVLLREARTIGAITKRGIDIAKLQQVLITPQERKRFAVRRGLGAESRLRVEKEIAARVDPVVAEIRRAFIQQFADVTGREVADVYTKLLAEPTMWALRFSTMLQTIEHAEKQRGTIIARTTALQQWAANQQKKAAEDQAAVASSMLTQLPGMLSPIKDALAPLAGVTGRLFGVLPTAKKPRVSVTINKIEVQSEDPDRFVFGMVSAIQDAVRNPSSAIEEFKEG